MLDCETLAFIEEAIKQGALKVEDNCIIINPNVKCINFTNRLRVCPTEDSSKVEIGVEPMVLTKKAGIGFTRKGGMIRSRKCCD